MTDRIQSLETRIREAQESEAQARRQHEEHIAAGDLQAADVAYLRALQCFVQASDLREELQAATAPAGCA